MHQVPSAHLVGSSQAGLPGPPPSSLAPVPAEMPCLSVSLYLLGYHENGVVRAENGASPRTKKLKSP